MFWGRRKFTNDELREIQDNPNMIHAGYWYDYDDFKRIIAEKILEKNTPDDLLKYLQYVIQQNLLQR